MEAQFCPTCGVSLSQSVRARRTRISITPLGRAVLAELRAKKTVTK